MPRKPNSVIYKERLAELTSCPDTIFEKITPSDELIERIALAESGDTDAIRQLTEELCSAYMSGVNGNSALIYILKLGIKHGVLDSARQMIRYADTFNEEFDGIGYALTILGKDDCDSEIMRILDSCIFKHTVILGNKAPEYAQSMEYNEKIFSHSRLYHMIKSGEYIENFEECRAVAQECGLESILTLPACGSLITERAYNVGDLDEIINTLKLSNLDEWMNFFIRCAYEYCEKYENGNFMRIADAAISVIERRRYDTRKELWLLAWNKYRAEHTDKNSDEFKNALACFENILSKLKFSSGAYDKGCRPDTTIIMKKSVCIDENEEKSSIELSEILAHEIRHVKNRYLIECTLRGHIKRVNKHMWQTTLSIKNEKGDPVTFKELRLRTVNVAVTRWGVTLPIEKHICQYIADGEIAIGDRVSPLEVDLILDISHVSASKCESIEIKVRGKQRYKGYDVYDCQLFISGH